MNCFVHPLLALPLWLPGCQLAAPQESGPGLHHLKVQGVQRSYQSFRPESVAVADEVPLLFAFHGGSGSAEQARKHFGFDDLARQHGFMVVYPEAVDGHWNDGRQSEKFTQQDASIDDVVYFRAVLEDVKAHFKIDVTRIYAMGASNGGMFVQRLALEETGTFAAVASTISSLPESLGEGFQPKAPLSVLFMSGTEDPIMPFLGGEVVVHLFGGHKKRRWEPSRGRVLPVLEAAQLWVNHNKIVGPVEDTLLSDSDPNDGCRVRLHLWKDEKPGSPCVALYEVIGGGHTLPQLESKAPKRIVGKTCQDIGAPETIWRFFADKRRFAEEPPKPPPGK